LKSQSTFRHEEQHAFEKLIVDLRADEVGPLFRAQNDEEREKAWRIFLQERLYRFHAYAKDELLAYFRGGTSKLKSVYLKLTRSQEENGSYDFLTEFGKIDREFITRLPFPENSQPEALKILEEVYNRDEYNQTIKDGLNSYARLVKGGYSKEMAINLLSTEPLTKWPLAVKRMLETKE